ncbi:MAG: excinuclease ABC subunit UvrC, partial [Oscillospiraceae bacterium]
APCRGKMKEAEYAEAVNEALDFIRGGSSDSVSVLEKRMTEAAEQLDFELAGKLRDRISAIRKMRERQKVVASKVLEQDVIALAAGEKKSALTVLKFKGGRLFDRQDFVFPEAEAPEELRGEFIRQYYDTHPIPPQITVDGVVADRELLTRWLSQKSGRKTVLHLPQKGEQLQLVEMCRNNAAEKLSEGSERTGREISALDELSRLLGLSSPPKYIEAYDISNLAGGENVAGMVVFENGRPLKSAYRKFKIKTVLGQDDYGSMREVIERRFGEYFQKQEAGETEGFGRLPDLILLDGGKGHVGAVTPVVRAMGISVPIFGMVKDDKHRTRAIALTGGEIAINSNRKAFTLISGIQDEVHRFAIGFHRQQRKKAGVSSSLLSIEGIGQERAKALLKQFRTLSAIREADLQELQNAPGMTKPSGKKVWDYFHNGE